MICLEGNDLEGKNNNNNCALFTDINNKINSAKS